MKSAVVTQECVSELPDDSPRNLAGAAGPFTGRRHILREEVLQTNTQGFEASESLRSAEAALAATNDALRLTVDQIDEAYLQQLTGSIEEAVSGRGEISAQWVWLGDNDRWEAVRDVIAGGCDVSDEALNYICLKHEHAERLMLNRQFPEALRSFVFILQCHRLDRLAMVKLSLCMLALWRTKSVEDLVKRLLQSVLRADPKNDHLKSLLRVLNKIIMCDDVDLMEQLQVDTLSEGILLALLEIVSSADVHRRSEPLIQDGIDG